MVAKEQRFRRTKILAHACANPLVILLLVLAFVTYFSDESHDIGGPTVMLVMVVLGVGLRFIQESRADTAAAKLKAMISVTATVLRDGQPRELPLGHLVPGDVVQLAAGDMIPADLRLVSCKDLFVIQSSLTGESLPVEKFDAQEERRLQAGAGTQEHLFSRHERGKRRGHGGDRRNGIQDLLGQHGPVAGGTAAADELRQGREPASPG